MIEIVARTENGCQDGEGRRVGGEQPGGRGRGGARALLGLVGWRMLIASPEVGRCCLRRPGAPPRSPAARREH
jgi:hypothetical protein